MDDSGLSRKKGTSLVGLIADSDDIIERNVHQFVDMLGTMFRNVYTCFLHHPHRIGVQSMGFNACGIRLNGLTLESPRPILLPSDCGKNCLCKGIESSVFVVADNSFSVDFEHVFQQLTILFQIRCFWIGLL